ncbi:MAG: T9SS type A sorting domain-containing protein, partial [Ignavibacteria bacterium]|nr:T9SS type A sorting domain-containing protein [Ignavibacteria bacterium]
MKRFLFISILIISSISLFSQHKARVMSYNLLNYTDFTPDTRNDYFKKVISSVNPDLLVVQEIKTEASVAQFLSSVLSSKYKAGAFIPNQVTFESNNAIFYKDSLFNFISNFPIIIPADPGTSERDISEFKLVHKFSKDTLIIFSAHLKASSGTTNEQRRLKEVIKLREHTEKLSDKANFIIVGDFNIYNTFEPAYGKLIETTTKNYFIDPINVVGVYNNSAFASIHTQSTRENSFGGGASGGLDDRFDFIMISQAVKDLGGIQFIDGTYTAYGNDGSHYNLSINFGSNTAVSKEIADALHFASDHLPVYADFSFEVSTSAGQSKNFPTNYSLHQNYPNPFNPTTTIEYIIPSGTRNIQDFSSSSSPRNNGINVTLKVYDVLGREVATLVDEYKTPGTYNCEWRIANSELSSGIYFYKLVAGNFSKMKKMVLI